MATRSETLALVDTNVLLYSVFRDSQYHAASRALIDRCQRGEIVLCVTSQVLAEFYAVVTDGRRVAVPRSPDEALQAIHDLLAIPAMVVLPISVEAVSQWLGLALERQVSRGRIFDIQLVGSMLSNGVQLIYTFDRAGFERFSDLKVLTLLRNQRAQPRNRVGRSR